ncbi:hypothetical protein V1517DRAFT_345594 [Lipomyces orientalis]|uniref:Uncharacterized protein n=1 Tax=Lipomyces orientalis TaxID=1233043 RepID=A0ACC3TQ57_9ASCO
MPSPTLMHALATALVQLIRVLNYHNTWPNNEVGHIRFDDDSAGGGEEDGVNGVPDTPRTGYVTAEEDFIDSSGHGNESDDDDEAPEDVSFQGGRQAAIVQAQERKREVEILRDEQCAKRKANDSLFACPEGSEKGKERGE